MVAVMSDLRIQNDGELDLVQLIETLWIGKWKIVWIAVIPVLLIIAFQFTQPPASFVAKTEIREISSVEAQRYSESNAVGLFEVTQASILGLFIEELEQLKVLEEAIHKFKLLDASEYDDQKEYNSAVILLASSIVISPQQNREGLDDLGHWAIEFEFNDKDKWLDVLAYTTAAINEKVRTGLRRGFDTSFAIAQRKQAFAIEDLETKISNSRIDYERKTMDRLAFLGEQAAIARKLGVAKNTIEAQTFSAQSGMVANIKTDTPFYLRGFEAIEKEIELLGSRDDTRAFVSGLLKLEIEKRELEQDKTLERASSLFALTPIMTPAEFSAVSITLEATDFENQSRFLVLMGMALIIGGLIGVVFVLVTDGIRRR